MRTTIFSLLLLLSAVASAQQQYKDDLKKAIGIFNESMEYLGKRSKLGTPADTVYMLAKHREMNVAFVTTSFYGTEVEKKLISYYTGIFRFRLGYMFAEYQDEDDRRKAFKWYKGADDNLKQFMVKDAFPIEYWLDDEKYKIDGSYFNTIIRIMFVDMVNIAYVFKSTFNVEDYSRRALELKNLSSVEKFRMTVMLINSLEEDKRGDNETLNLYLSMWRSYKVLDTASQRKYLINDAQILERVKYLTDKIYATEDRGTTPAMVARIMFELNRNEDAEYFLKLAIQKQPNLELAGLDDEFYYKAMMNSYNFKDKDVMAWSSLRLITGPFYNKNYVDDVIMVLKFLGKKDDIKLYKYNLKHH